LNEALAAQGEKRTVKESSGYRSLAYARDELKQLNYKEKGKNRKTWGYTNNGTEISPVQISAFEPTEASISKLFKNGKLELSSVQIMDKCNAKEKKERDEVLRLLFTLSSKGILKRIPGTKPITYRLPQSDKMEKRELGQRLIKLGEESISEGNAEVKRGHRLVKLGTSLLN
jgi:hypothetical protein